MKKMTITVVLAAFGLAVQTASANLIVTSGNTNAGFEEATLAPWTVWDPQGPVSVSADYARSGQQALKIDSSGMSQTDFQVSDYIIGGETYDASAWYYLPSPLVDYEAASLRMIFYRWEESTSDWAQVGTPLWDTAYGPEPGLPDESTSGVWTQLSLSAAAPIDAVMVDISLQARGAGSTFYFDDVSLIPEPGTAAMLMLGVGLLWFRRRFR
jgi:hypothetical protein